MEPAQVILITITALTLILVAYLTVLVHRLMVNQAYTEHQSYLAALDQRLKDLTELENNLAAEKAEPAPSSDVEESSGQTDASHPNLLVYTPKPGSKPFFCTCHRRPLREGEKVLWWPADEDGHMVIFCEHSEQMQSFSRGMNLQGMSE